MSSLTPCDRFKYLFQKEKFFQLEQENFYKNFSKLLPQINIPSNFPNMTVFKDAKIIATYKLKNPEYKISALLKIYELYLKLTTTYKNALNNNKENKENKERKLKMVERKTDNVYSKITNAEQKNETRKPLWNLKKKKIQYRNVKYWNDQYNTALDKKRYLELAIKTLRNSINTLNSLEEKNLFKETFEFLFKAKRVIFNLENSKQQINQKTLYLTQITITLERFSKTFIEENRFDLENKENKEILDKIQSLVRDIHDYILRFINLVKSEFKEDEKKIATPKFLSLFETWILSFISCYATLTNNIKMKDCSIKYFFDVVDYLTTLYVADEIQDIAKNKKRIGEIIKRLKLSKNREFTIYALALTKLKGDLAANILYSFIENIRKGNINYENSYLQLIERGLKEIPYFIIQKLISTETSKISTEFNLFRPEETSL